VFKFVEQPFSFCKNAETGDIAAYSCKDSTDSLEYNGKETKKKKIMRGNG